MRERSVAFLARESRVPVVEVEQLYDAELAVLSAGARILAFLDILTSRKVRETLRGRGYAPAAALQSAR
jgi:hypothetical protein